MIVRINGITFRTLNAMANPACWLPKLLPISFETVRVGTDCHNFARLIIRV